MESLAYRAGLIYIIFPAMLRVCKYLWLKFYIFLKILLTFMFQFFIKAAYQ